MNHRTHPLLVTVLTLIVTLCLFASSSSADTVPPGLSGMAQDQTTRFIELGQPVIYTVSFNEDMAAGSVSAADFSNAGNSTISIGTITEITPGVFSVPITPTSIGKLQLQIPAGAVLTDVAGNSLATTSALLDDETLRVYQTETQVPAYVGASSVTSSSNKAISMAMPAGVQSGDLMIASIVQVGGNMTDATATGWLTLSSGQLGGSHYATILYRFAMAGESGPFTFTLKGGSPSGAGAIMAFSGVDQTSPFEYFSSPSIYASQSLSSAAGPANNIPSASANAMVVLIGMAAGTNLGTWSDWANTSPGALTERYDGLGNGNTLSLGAACNTKLTAGATGVGSAQLSASGYNGLLQVGLKPAGGGRLISALTALKKHITGEAPLSDAEIATNKGYIDADRSRFATSASAVVAAMEFVETYDSVLGPLWVSRTLPDRSSVINDIHWTMYKIMQYLMDDTYSSANLASFGYLLNGFKFGSSANFPGSCTPPADPSQSHTALIDGNFLNTRGWPTFGESEGVLSREPTGTYLAPGSIATVTVPTSMVNRGYKIRVGAHSWDLSNKILIRRLDRSSLTYAIVSTSTQISSPLGGGIYIEVPQYISNVGVVSVQIQNAVRSPYFSSKSFHQTSLSQWQNTERHHQAPWADFQSDKYMMQVPTSWIYALDDPVTLMADWDKAVDACNDLMGFPRIRGFEGIYNQVDVIIRGDAFAPGYPASNDPYTPGQNYNGYANNYLVRGPQYAPDQHFHEHGHGYLFPKFPSEQESDVNLLHVAVTNDGFGIPLDDCFYKSRSENIPYRTLDTTAIAWMMCDNFLNGVAMTTEEKQYQLKGHAKFVDTARLLGWGALKNYYGKFIDEFEQGTSKTTLLNQTTDQLLLRLCIAAGKDIRPLFHFWGMPPQNASTLASQIAAAGLKPSPEILDALNHYKALIPADNAAFQTFALDWWQRQPLGTGFIEEQNHSSRWSTYNTSSATATANRLQTVINLYYPSGIAPDPMYFAVPPFAMNSTTIRMTAATAAASIGPVQYYFENTTNSTNSGWTTNTTWTQSGLTNGVTYSYRVKVRNGNLSETAWSASASAKAEADTTPPTPSPMTFAVNPTALNQANITMTASTASDINGVEYYFQCTAGGGPSSNWQADTQFTATGLTPSSSYTYVVRARDAYGNTTANSTGQSATTTEADLTDPLATMFYPAHQATEVAPVVNLEITFSEAIAIGTGNITIRNLSDGSGSDVVIPITDANQVLISGTTLIINPTANLDDGKNLAIRIDGTAITDLWGNAYAGISNDSSWAFATATVPFVWTQTAGGAQDWTTGANWLYVAIPNPEADDWMDFSTANLAADTTLRLGADRGAQLWKFGDTAGAQNWIVNAGNQMILSGTNPTIQVNNNTTTLNNVVSSSSGLRKTGAGTLHIASANTSLAGAIHVSEGTLYLSGDNNFSSGITVSGGILQVSKWSHPNALGVTSNLVTFTGNGGLKNGDGAYTMAQSIQINTGVTASLSGGFGETLHVEGALMGDGNLNIEGLSNGQVVNLNHASNTLTGTIWVGSNANGSVSLSMKSIADSANPLKFGNGGITASYTLTGLAAPVVFNNRSIELAGTTGTVTIKNIATGSNTFTIHTDLLVTGVGTKTLTLAGTNIGANTFAGDIANGSGTISIAKSEAGTWILSGNNGYTGATMISAGKLFINGDQSAATGAISVASNATLGGTGTLGGNTTIADGGKLEFTLSTAAAGHNPLDLASGKTLTFSGSSALTISCSGNAAPGTYTLLAAPGGITGTAPATLNLPAGWLASVSIVSNNLVLNVTKVAYSVSYHGNGHTGGAIPLDGAAYDANSTVTVLGNTNLLTRTGYLFSGWNTATNGSGSSYATNDTFPISTYTTLYAQWTAVPTYTISYDTNGATIGSAPASQIKTQTMDLILSNNSGSLVKTSAVLSGWNTSASGSGGTHYALGGTYTADASVVLYAEWTPTYTLGYSAGVGGSITGSISQIVVQGASGTAVTALPDTGYRFTGWSDSVSTETRTDTNVTGNLNVTANFALNVAPSVDAGPDTVIALGAVPWSPSRIAMHSWHDAADAGSINHLEGAVSAWADKSGNGRNATQTNSSFKPFTGTRQINGKNAIDLNATNTQYLNIPSFDAIGNEVWAVFVSDAASPILLGAGGNVQIGLSANKMRLWQQSNPYSADTKSATAIAVSTPAVAGWLAHTDTKKFSINGTLQTTTDAYNGTGTMSPTMIGKGQYADTMDGAIGELIVTPTLSLENRQKMEGYLAHKWGLQTSLPDGAGAHPYRSSEPTAPGAAVTLAAASASDSNDDSFSTSWSVVSGPAAVVFDDVSALHASATFTQAGTYTLRLTASDGALQATDDIVITVKDLATVSAWPSAAAITEGQPLSAATLSGGTASVAGSFSFDSPSTVPAIGTSSQAVTFMPTDSANYMSVGGTVNVTVLSIFEAWAIANGTGSETFSGDANGDGVADGMAWLLGATGPADNANALLPPAAESGGDLALSFKLRKPAARGSAQLQLQYSKDLGVSDPWTNHTITVPDSSDVDASGVVFVVTPVAGQDYDQVQATVPASAAGGTGKVFVRLLGETP